ncbi:CubicO group peptidase (beta-lactamase class C family) [Kribbella voronezhensis]|uniref:CubicO group peptidase (Beta-lactamase class C family) n=1 Tax=Kribbella voronezhensis TaxID=2512212 RepID=A0A4R7SUY4_9ACTN|nr:serine hydrolase domain-containing protein [Kribbella voronezhensis]TDU82619.1 CubicO group peptidase (beta-lactamase class C family) [Kribbella voronezhensis]
MTNVVKAEIEADLAEFQVPGVSWAVIEGGQIVEHGSAGLVDAGRSDLVTERTLFQACSISKPVAVLAALRLVDQGLLDLDEDVNNRLKSWRVPRTGDWQPVVTLRQLVSHSAGLTVHGFPGYLYGEELPNLRQLLDGVPPATNFGVRVDTVPGTQFRYSGGGTLVVQQLLEDVTGTPFRQLMQELVLGPLGMFDSDYAQPLPEDRHNQAAVAHDDLGQPIEGRWHSYPELAAAGLWTTPSDLLTFAQAIKNSYDGVEGAPLSPELAREALTPQVPSSERIGGLEALGLGLFLGQAGRLFGHSGSNAGFRCHLLAYRETGQGAAVMTNGDNGSWVVEKAFVNIASAYGWADYPATVSERVGPDVDVLAGWVGTYRLREGLSLEVERSGTELVVKFPGQSPLRFRAMSGDRFGASTADTELRFDDGGVVFVQNGEEIRCPRE